MKREHYMLRAHREERESQPYRELALVPSAVEPAALWPWHDLSRRCPCPKCGAQDIDGMVQRGRPLCTGHMRFWTHWPWGRANWPFGRTCTETREHFHVQCSACGWTTLMATADAT